MAETRTHMTADELLRLPDTGMRYELADGELIEKPPAGGEHGFTGGRAHVELGWAIKRLGLGGAVFTSDTGFRLSRDPDTVRAADVAYVAEPRLARARVPGYTELAPDLVVEVVSPGDTGPEVQAKVDGWLRGGTRLAWALDPATRSAVVHEPGVPPRVLYADDTLHGEPVVPGFACRVGDLF